MNIVMREATQPNMKEEVQILPRLLQYVFCPPSESSAYYTQIHDAQHGLRPVPGTQVKKLNVLEMWPRFQIHSRGFWMY